MVFVFLVYIVQNVLDAVELFVAFREKDDLISFLFAAFNILDEQIEILVENRLWLSLKIIGAGSLKMAAWTKFNGVSLRKVVQKFP